MISHTVPVLDAATALQSAVLIFRQTDESNNNFGVSNLASVQLLIRVHITYQTSTDQASSLLLQLFPATKQVAIVSECVWRKNGRLQACRLSPYRSQFH